MKGDNSFPWQKKWVLTFLQTMSLHQPSHREKMAHFLEQRSKEGLIDSETVAEHQRMNRNMMSQKMMEMTRLQNSLTDQAKVFGWLGLKSIVQLFCRTFTQPFYYCMYLSFSAPLCPFIYWILLACFWYQNFQKFDK